MHKHSVAGRLVETLVMSLGKALNGIHTSTAIQLLGNDPKTTTRIKQ